RSPRSGCGTGGRWDAPRSAPPRLFPNDPACKPSGSAGPGWRGLLRDSATFSVIAAEWPAVKSALTARVRPARQRPGR
ncbi:MAG: hypothetical protein ABSA53_17240, partial [Streptosporangiaceae bacterium]